MSEVKQMINLIEGSINHLISVVALDRDINKEEASEIVAEWLLEKGRSLGAVFADHSFLEAVQESLIKQRDIKGPELMELIMEMIDNDNK